MSTNSLTPSYMPQAVDAVRAFNRFWTAKIGALGGTYLKSGYSLTEGRVLFELAHRAEVEVSDLRRELDLDAGYLSRILGRFKTEKLVGLAPSEADARKQIARLTSKGRELFGALDGRAAEAMSAMLEGLTEEEQHRLVAAMSTVNRILGEVRPPNMYILRPLGPGDLGWVVRRHAVLYETSKFDQSFEALVARIMADYIDHHDPERENAWIAEVDGEPVGCVFCVKKSATVAQLRCLLVEPRTRGSGIGARLVDECVRFARKAGYRRMMLYTHKGLVSARRIYDHAGFTVEKEEPAHTFGRDVVEQTLSMAL